MNGKNHLDKRYQAIAWGALFILIGTLSLIPGDQTSLALLGGGAILLGLNLSRTRSGLPVNRFTIVIGGVALLTGGSALIGSKLGLHYEIDLFPVMLIAVGVYWLWPPRRSDESGG